MKIFIESDIHISDRGPMMRGGQSRLDYIKNYVDWKHQYLTNHSEIDRVINCGDLTSSDVLTATEQKTLAYYLNNSCNLKQTTTHVLGNHERKDKEGDFTSLELLVGYPNHYLKRAISIERDYDNNLALVMVPYGCESEFLELLKTDKLNGLTIYAFTHTEFVPQSGAGGFVGLDTTDYVNCKIFNGHIHNAHNEFGINNNIINIGSPLGSNLADDYSTSKPGIIILDTNTGEYERIENPYAPLYFKIESEADIPLLENKSRAYVSTTLDKLEGFTNVSKIVSIETPEKDDEPQLEVQEDIMDSLREYYTGNKKVLDELNKININ